mmetsp:Transcript_1504/g.3590  ORF Transcript_1504/g.3590 Transcript_1504/m.3590 type:complete len:82 (+) Transcript_1504:387-632(+)
MNRSEYPVSDLPPVMLVKRSLRGVPRGDPRGVPTGLEAKLDRADDDGVPKKVRDGEWAEDGLRRGVSKSDAPAVAVVLGVP